MVEIYRGIQFNIKRKCSNNIVITVKRENKAVSVTAPFTISDEELKVYLSANASEIKEMWRTFNMNIRKFLDYFLTAPCEIFGAHYFVSKPEIGVNTCYDVDFEKHMVYISMRPGITDEQTVLCIQEQYCSIIKPEIEKAVSETLTALDMTSVKWDFNWQIRGWVKYSAKKNTLYINPQIAQCSIDYLKFAALDELMKCSHVADSQYESIMKSYVDGWKKKKLWCDNHHPETFNFKYYPHKIELISSKYFDEIKNIAEKDATGCHATVQSIINLRCDKMGKHSITYSNSFDAIVMCEYDSGNVECFRIPCDKVNNKIFLGNKSVYLPNPADYENDNIPEEFVPPISEDNYADEANKFLAKHAPYSLKDICRVHIREIAENTGIVFKEFDGLEEKLHTPCILVFDDCCIVDVNNNVVIDKAKANEVYIDKAEKQGDKNAFLARAFFKRKLHGCVYKYIKTLKSKADKTNSYVPIPIDTQYKMSSEHKKSVYEAKNPELITARERMDEQVLQTSAMAMVHDNGLDKIIQVIKEDPLNKRNNRALYNIPLLATVYDTSNEDIIRRLFGKGIPVTEDETADDISSDLYDSVIDDVNNAELNALRIQNMNDSFSETLNKLIKENYKKGKNSTAQLVSDSGISKHTLSRLRTKNGQEVSLQMILGVCCGLSLSLPETEMLLDKSPFRLQPSIIEHYAYKAIIPFFRSADLETINNILDAAGIKRIGYSKDKDK